MAFDELPKLLLALVILLILLAFVFKITPVLRAAGDHCAADIMTAKLSGGIRCPVQSFTASTAEELAKEFTVCAQRFGSLKEDPFPGQELCIVCSMGELSAEVHDVDVALLTQRNGAVYQELTGKIPHSLLRSQMKKTEDTYPRGQYAIVWLNVLDLTIEDWLAKWEYQRPGEIWHGNILELDKTIGIGNGIFRPDQEGHNQALMVMPAQAAEHCLQLDKGRFSP